MKRGKGERKYEKLKTISFASGQRKSPSHLRVYFQQLVRINRSTKHHLSEVHLGCVGGCLRSRAMFPGTTPVPVVGSKPASLCWSVHLFPAEAKKSKSQGRRKKCNLIKFHFTSFEFLQNVSVLVSRNHRTANNLSIWWRFHEPIRH